MQIWNTKIWFFCASNWQKITYDKNLGKHKLQNMLVKNVNWNSISGGQFGKLTKALEHCELFYLAILLLKV